MRVIMTGGGTGGHIYPAISIADAVKKRFPYSEILFVGTEKGLESTIVPKAGYEIRYITSSGFNRKHLSKNIKTVKDLMKGLNEAGEIIKEFKPDKVIGTGGYVSGPVVFAAAKKGIDTYIHEQNALPGLTNKLLQGKVKKIFSGYEEGIKAFKDHKKVVFTGNPVRAEFINQDRELARKNLGLKKDDFMLLAFGGSRGAGRLNSAMLKSLDILLTRKELKVFLISGRNYYDAVKSELKHEIKLMPYSDEMNVLLSASDLVISRSGALATAEINALGKASILIPSPNVTNNHQYYNAKAVADKNAAILIPEDELNEKNLTKKIFYLMDNPTILKEMEKNSKLMGKIDSAEIICDSL